MRPTFSFCPQKIILICVTLLLHAYPTAALANSNTPRTLLWEISGNGLAAPSYLFGTIHALCPEEFKIPDKVASKLKLAEQLSLEVDMDAPNFMAELMQHATLPAGKTLSSFFSQAEYKMLQAHLHKSFQLDLKMFENLKPFMLQSLLLSQLTDCKAISYEQRLMELAHAQGKEIIGVESIQEQLAAMDKLPEQMQSDMLVKTVKDLPSAKTAYKKMVKLYLAQDLVALTQLTKEDFSAEEYTLYEEMFLVSRNKRWIPVIEREARAKPTFFAVGAGHLAGEHGVLELLRSKGYTITPVMD